MVAVILLKAVVALILLEAVVALFLLESRGGCNHVKSRGSFNPLRIHGSSCSMAIVALFLLICHSGSFSLKQSWWLYNSLMTITLLKAVVALFLFNGYSSYIPVKLA